MGTASPHKQRPADDTLFDIAPGSSKIRLDQIDRIDACASR